MSERIIPVGNDQKGRDNLSAHPVELVEEVQQVAQMALDERNEELAATLYMEFEEEIIDVAESLKV